VTLLVTTGTVTSFELLGRRVPELGGRILHRFIPLDVPAWVAAFLDHWRPDAGALVESELWPNLLAACAARRMKLLLINGRLSPRSFARWRRLPGAAHRLFGAFSEVQAQSAADAERFAALGAHNVTAPGNLKNAAAPLPFDTAALEDLTRLLAGRPVWLAASTHPGEEDIIVTVHTALAADHPGLLTIIAPRHPTRGGEVAHLCGSLSVTRRSLREPPPLDTGLWIADTLGELGLLYRAVPIVFMGRSLAVFGGQNPLEPARLGCAIATGPRTENFAEAVAALGEAGALSVVADAPALGAWVNSMLNDPARRAVMGQAGIAVATAASDLPDRIADDLLSLARA
jgi:3-deoxy-D-manno-octulosonic-acid transferase